MVSSGAGGAGSCVVLLLAEQRLHLRRRFGADRRAAGDRLEEPRHLRGGGRAEAVLALLVGIDVGLAAAEGRPVEARLAAGRSATMRSFTVLVPTRATSRLVAVLSESAIIRYRRSATGLPAPRVQRVQHAGAADLGALGEGDQLVVAEPSAAIWWKTSTITAVLIALAVGNRSSASTAIVSPVARWIAATPIRPSKGGEPWRDAGLDGGGGGEGGERSRTSTSSMLPDWRGRW